MKMSNIMNGKIFKRTTFLKKKTPQWQNELEDDPLIKGTKSLSNIYQICKVAIQKPARHKKKPLKYLKWKKAMEEEMSMIKKNKIWELAYRLEGKKVIGVK